MFGVYPVIRYHSSRPERCSIFDDCAALLHFMILYSSRCRRSASHHPTAHLQSQYYWSNDHQSQSLHQTFFSFSSPGNLHLSTSFIVTFCHSSNGNHPILARSPKPPNQYTYSTTSRIYSLSWLISLPGCHKALSGCVFKKHCCIRPLIKSALEIGSRWPCRLNRGRAAGV